MKSKHPFFAIQGYLELLSDGAAENPILSKKFIGQAESNVQRLVSLLNDVDLITNLEINKDSILKQHFNHTRFDNRSCSKLKCKIAEKKYTISIQKRE